MKNKITLSMIVKNEEKYLAGCLESVKGIADEIVVVDTGSQDKTIEIADSFGAKVYHYNWCNDFSAARNYALEKSAGTWILYLDADERLAPDSREKLLSIACNDNDGRHAVRCLVNSIDDIGGNPKLMKYTRFFMNSPGISFKGKIHEQIDDSLLREKYTFSDSDIEILHLGYNIEKSGINDKAKRNLELLLDEYASNPSSYYEYHLGITYDILGNKSESARFFTLALKDKKLPREYRAICNLNLAVFYSSEVFDLQTAEQMLLKGLSDEPDNVMLNLVASEIFGKTGKTEKALNLCLNAHRNNKKMAGNKLLSSIFGIYVNPEKIVYRGLYLSVQMQNQKAFGEFLNDAQPDLKEVIISLLNKRNINSKQAGWILKEINEFNADLILLLLDMDSGLSSVKELLISLSNRFPSDTRYLMALGNHCYKNNALHEALHYYKEALETGGHDPSPVFYMISVYVALNDISPISDLLEYADRHYGHIPLFKEKMNQLKQKLLGVL